MLVAFASPSNGQRIATRVDGSLYYVHSDLLGSTVALSDAAGQAVGRVQYDPYGEVLTSTLPAALTQRLFTGQRFDSSSGLYYYNARYYDPHLGRFIQPDSLVPDPLNPQAWNRFSYCGNNPATYNDPSGHLIPLIIAVPLLIAGGAIILDYGLQVHSNMSNYGMSFWEAGYHENINEWEMVNVGATTFMAATLAIEAPALLLAGGGALAMEYAMQTGSTRAFAMGMWLSNAAAEYSAFWWAGAVSEAEALQGEFVGYHGTSSVHKASILRRINPPPSGLNFRGYSQLGEGFYVTPGSEAAEWFAARAAATSGGDPVVLRIYVQGFGQMTSANIPRSLWGLKPFPSEYITDYDYLVAPVSSLEHWSQIKFNPRVYDLLKAFD